MNNTIKFFAVCVAAPVMALGAAPAAWADKGGTPQGGHTTTSGIGGTATVSGTRAVPGGQDTGRTVATVTITQPPVTITNSGNFTNPANPHGHCTRNGVAIACP